MLRLPLRLIGLASALVAAVALTIAPTQALPAWTTSNSSWTNPRAWQPLVTDLRYATHPNFDRVVIDIEGRIPSWHATYQKRFVEDGSGQPVPIRGGLLVTLSARAHSLSGHNAYDGPHLVRPGFEALKAIAFTGDFEGVVSFAFGLDPQRSPYRIFRLSDPQRLVIDFRH